MVRGNRVDTAAGGGPRTAASLIVLGLLLIATMVAITSARLPRQAGVAALGGAGLLLVWRGLAARRAAAYTRPKAQSIAQVFAASESVLSSLDVNQVLQTAAETGGRLSWHASEVLLFLAGEARDLALRSSWGIDPPPPVGTRFPLIEPFLIDAVNDRRPVVTSLPADPMPAGAPGRLSVRSACVFPLHSRGELVGVFVLLSHKSARAFSPELTLLEYFAKQAAMAIDNARLYQQVQDLFVSSIKALAAAVDAKDAYTHDHSEDLVTLVSLIARELHLLPQEEEKLKLAALLHDIGKIGVPDAILRKPGTLDPSERAIMMNHAVLGASILDKPGPLQELASIVRHHHERHDGRGYPDGLRGNDIPTGAAILAVADAFDAMTSYRPYRQARPLDKAMEELVRNAGTQFHPRVVEALAKVLEHARTNHSRWYQKLQRRSQPPTADQPPVVPQPPAQTHADLIVRLSQEVRPLGEVPTLLVRIIDFVVERLGFPQCAILLIGDDEQVLTVEVGVGSVPEKGTTIPRGRAPAWQAIEQRAAQWRDDGSAIFAPLLIDRAPIGVLEVDGTDLGEEDMRLLAQVADTIAPLILAAQLRQRIERVAAFDELTGLYNRKALLSRLAEETSRYHRYGTAFALVLADIEGLSVFNATYGYLAGDELIQRIAEILRSNARQADVPARLAGGTFAFLMPELDAGEAQVAMQRMRALFVDRQIPIRGQFVTGTTLTWTMVSCPQDGLNADALLSHAERLLDANLPPPASPNVLQRG